MLIVHMLVGIPGAGKSTLARQIAPAAVVVSADTIRLELYGSLRAAHETDRAARLREVFDVFHDRIARHLAAGADVVADATHLTVDARRHVLDVADAHGARVHAHLFADVGQALVRNRARGHDARVPHGVQAEMVTRFRAALDRIAHEPYHAVTTVTTV